MAVSTIPKKVLLADDEKAIAKALSLKLAKVGFVVDIAVNGVEAIEKAKAGKFDIIVLDLIMPEKDGFAVLEYLKENKITTPVLVASNLSQEEDLKRAQDLGAVDYFVKSNMSLQEIVDNIKKVLKV
ncbi:MAG: response regulator [Patescibacteria group bacterium]|jgi:DNA-binding response OmpR family regulator